VEDWNISRIIPAGRAKWDYVERWAIENEDALAQVGVMRRAFPSIQIGYSDRVNQGGYFLLVLPDGSLATQFTDSRDKVVIGHAFTASLNDLRDSRDFDLHEHCRKWIASVRSIDPFDDLLAA
jgi:hypothetical protein